VTPEEMANLPKGSIEDHVGVMAMGDIHKWTFVAEWAGIACETIAELPSGKQVSISGYNLKLTGSVGLDFGRPVELIMMIPDDVAKPMAEHILEALRHNDTRVVEVPEVFRPKL
jgi:hypothetical protein